MGYEINGVYHCDHCGLPVVECQRLSKIIGTCKDYNALAEDYRDNLLQIKPIGVTDEEAIKMVVEA